MYLLNIYFKAEWEDLTDSVDFKITDNGSVSFMTNVSARFWVVQIINESDTGLVESLASDVYKEAIKVPYLATFAIRKVFKLIVRPWLSLRIEPTCVGNPNFRFLKCNIILKTHISTIEGGDFENESDLKLCCRCGTKLDVPQDSRLYELSRSKPVEVFQDTKIWIDVVGDIRKRII